MSSSLAKTANGSALAVQSVSSATLVTQASPVDVSTKFSITFYVHFGRRANTALSASFTLRCEVSPIASGDGQWYLAATFVSKTAAVTSQAVFGTCSSGQNVVPMASTTGMAVGDVVYIENGTIGNSEWGRIKTVTTSTSITLEDNLAHAQTGSTVYPSAETASFKIDCADVLQARAVADNLTTGQSIAIEVKYSTTDSIG